MDLTELLEETTALEKMVVQLVTEGTLVTGSTDRGIGTAASAAARTSGPMQQAEARKAPSTPPAASQPFRAGRSAPVLSVLSSVSAMSRTSRL